MISEKKITGAERIRSSRGKCFSVSWLFPGVSGWLLSLVLLTRVFILAPASRIGGRGVPRLWCLGPALVLACWVGFGVVTGSQAVQGASGSNPVERAGGLGISAAELAQRLTAARAHLTAAVEVGVTNAPTGVSPEDIWTRNAALHRLVRLYEQQLSNVQALDEARARKAEAVREVESWTRFGDPPPYSILLVDRLRGEIQAERQKVRSGESSSSLLNQIIEENRDALSQAEEKIRQLNERLESAADPAVRARLSWQRDFERLRSQVAAASVAVVDSERQVGLETLAESRVRLGLLERQLILAEAGAQFTQADLDKVTSRIERQQEQLERELAEAERRQQAAIRALEAAQAELRAFEASARKDADLVLAREGVATRQAQAEAADTATSVLRLMLEGANTERTMWELRFAAHDSPSVNTLSESARRLKAFSRRLGLWRDYAHQQSNGAASQIQIEEARLNSLPPKSELLPVVRERLAALRGQDEMLLRLARSIENLDRLTERWAEGLRAAEGKLPLTDRVRSIFSDARSVLQRLWSFEVYAAVDTITVDGQEISGRRSVTIGKIVMVLGILVVGYWITGLITACLEPLIVKRLKIERNQAGLIGRWLRAFLVACLVLLSLVSVKIPLTVFAFAGGALAIALGFGMQTIMKNFVSGLILLFERPFRVGDVLDVGGQRGIITSIGLRASVLQLWDGTETIIPNSFLLENNVTNWTYSNRKVRFNVAVGVAYDSEPRRVMQLLEEIAQRHGLVEKDPKPQVLFTDFGDSTLSFELRFWVDVARANSAQVCSDIRLMIAGAFAEHGIVIDYPQQDVHLHSTSPLQVQVMPATAGPAAKDAATRLTKASEPPPLSRVEELPGADGCR